jgi:hypothetical protein
MVPHKRRYVKYLLGAVEAPDDLVAADAQAGGEGAGSMSLRGVVLWLGDEEQGGAGGA